MQMDRSQFQARLQELKKLIKKKERALAKVPEGSLRVCRRKGKPQYYHLRPGAKKGGTYISVKDRKLIEKLAQKDYDRRVLEAARKEQSAIVRFLKEWPSNAPEDVFFHLRKERQDMVVPIEMTDEDFIRDWMEQTGGTKGFWEEDPQLYTAKGERVRSKSEVIIANELAAENIPYRYEEVTVLNGFGTVYPDFKVLNIRLRKTIIWEHLGLIEDPEYAQRALRKLLAYIENGYYPGDNLIITWETADRPLNLKTIREKISNFCR